MRTTQVVDLCSGGSGPWGHIEEYARGLGETICVTLTDKYPNIRAFKKTKSIFGGIIGYVSETVDATSVPINFKGMRTIFSAFHHFDSDAARKILQNAADQRSAIGIFELTERRLDKIIFCLLAPFIVLLIVPFIRPINFKRIFWVYFIPVIPFVFMYDAFVSYLRSYSPEDLRELVKGVNAKGYEWKIDRIVSRVNPMRITYLLGFPKEVAMNSNG